MFYVDKNRQEKEEELRTLERKLVVLLEEQQNELNQVNVTHRLCFLCSAITLLIDKKKTRCQRNASRSISSRTDEGESVLHHDSAVR
jgi:hypothetical protein